MPSIDVVTLQLPEAFDGQLTERAVVQYAESSGAKKFLETLVIGPFTGALHQATGYSDDNRPTKVVTVPLKAGDLEFKLEVKPTTKRPGYADVFDRLTKYLETVETHRREMDENVARLIEGIGYCLAAGVIPKRVREWKEEITELGVEYKIVEQPEADLRPQLAVPIRGYDSLSQENGRMYVQASAFADELDRRAIKAFEQALKENTGYTKTNRPAKTALTWLPLGRHLTCA